MSEWVSVKNESPPKDKVFLGYIFCGYNWNGIFEDNINRKIQTCVWCNDLDRIIESCDCSGYEHERAEIELTHWMPLPEKPKD